MPGRAEELYKMHLIIAPRWMREINGFPFSETTASAFFSSSKPQFVAAARYSPAYHCAAFPFTLSSYALVDPSTGRAGNKGDTWIRDYIAAMKSNLSIHGTMDPSFDTASAISHFSRMKSFPFAGLFASEKYRASVFFAFTMLFENDAGVYRWGKHL